MYNHPECRNGNSIGVEICSDKDADGLYYFTDETLETAAELIRELMKKHDVPIERVIRHYDVTGKECPAPFVGAGYEDWKEFKELVNMKKYDKLEEIPAWGQPTIQKLMDFVRATGKTPALVKKEEDGFIVNNILKVIKRIFGQSDWQL